MKHKLMRIIVAGGRRVSDYKFIEESIDNYLNSFVNKKEFNIEIVSGNAIGVDELGERYSKEKGYKCTIIPAMWKTYGDIAGHIRNMTMGEYANDADIGLVIAFWNGESAGTKDMIDYANKINLPVYIVHTEYEKCDGLWKKDFVNEPAIYTIINGKHKMPTQVLRELETTIWRGYK